MEINVIVGFIGTIATTVVSIATLACWLGGKFAGIDARFKEMDARFAEMDVRLRWSKQIKWGEALCGSTSSEVPRCSGL